MKDVTMLEYSDHFPVIIGERSLWARRLVDADLAAVRIISRSARPWVGRALAVVISKLGNGWIYLIIGAVIFEWWGRAGFRVVILGGLNAGLLHCIFPRIKRRVGRVLFESIRIFHPCWPLSMSTGFRAVTRCHCLGYSCQLYLFGRPPRCRRLR